MANGIAPPGYRAELLAYVTNLNDLNLVTPLEDGTPEGSLMLMELDFGEYPAWATLEELNTKFVDAGVIPWPGNGRVVFADATRPAVYLCWVKAIAWMPIIIGMLVVTVLPALLGAFVWWLIPQEIKDLIVMVGMMLIMWGVFKMMTPLLAPAEGKKKEQ